jgi:hypothetical protein
MLEQSPDCSRITHCPEADNAITGHILADGAAFTNSRPLDKKWAFFPLGRRGQALGEVNDGESGQQCQNQADSQGGYLTV